VQPRQRLALAATAGARRVCSGNAQACRALQEVPPEQIEPVSVEGRVKPMRYLGTLVICVLLVGLTASAFAELRDAEVNGSVRVRGTWVGSPGFDSDNNDTDVVEQRTRLGVEATFTDDVSAFIELQMSNTWGDDMAREGAAGGFVSSWNGGYYNGYGMSNGFGGSESVDVYQAYIQADDMLEYPVSMRIGRQEMSYGTELLIGDRDFFQNGLSFDAVKLMYEDGDLAVDLWWSKLVELGTQQSDADTDFYGIYGTYSGVEDMIIDAYVLLVRQGATAETDNQYTVGARAAGALLDTGIDYNVEVARQFGEDGMGDDYEGWLLDLLLEYAIEAEYDPAVFAGYTFSTGDGSATDSDNERFTFPFTDNHARWGYSDAVGLGNMNVIKIGGSMCPTDKLTVIAQALWFLAHEDEDTVLGYTSSSNDDNVAQEVDLSLVYDYTEDLQFEMTYGHIFADDWIEDSLPEDDDIDLLYAQAAVSF